MRRKVLLGSLAVHAALGAALLGAYSARRRERTEPPPRGPTTIDIEIVEPPPKTPPPMPSPLPAGESTQPPSGSASGASPSAPAPLAPAPPPAGPLAITGYDHAPPPSTRGDGLGGDGLGGTGAGTGLGGTGLGGTGLGGTGLGSLASLPAPPPAPPPSPEKPPSKARPPKLIYPARDRDADDSELFVARVTIDHDGYVVGARLVRGLGGSQDEHASSLVWRFRYAPALDDEGHAIRATVDQRFLVSR